MAAHSVVVFFFFSCLYVATVSGPLVNMATAHTLLVEKEVCCSRQNINVSYGRHEILRVDSSGSGFSENDRDELLNGLVCVTRELTRSERV